jgi:hypothetical protein
MADESNMNILANTNPNIVVIDGIEFPIEYPEIAQENLNQNVEENTTPTIVENQRYNTIIETLGLNSNIDYSINALTDAIIEMHTNNKNNNNNYIAHHTRCFQFKTNSLSNKIKTNLVANGYLSNFFSKKDIKYALRSLLHKYNYDKIISSIDENEKVILTQHQEQMIGFNYNNPRWNTLSSYTFDIKSN